MYVFIFVFFPNSSNFSTFFSGRLGKNRKMLVFMEYVCMSGKKLTFVSFSVFLASQDAQEVMTCDVSPVAMFIMEYVCMSGQN